MRSGRSRGTIKLKRDRVEPELSVREFQRRHRELHNVQHIEQQFQSLLICFDLTEVDIRRQVPLAVAFDVGPVEDDITVIVFSHILICAKESLGARADRNIQPGRYPAFGKEGAEVHAQPIGLPVVILQESFRGAFTEEFIAACIQFRVIVAFPVEGEFELDALFVPGQFLRHQPKVSWKTAV